MPYDVSDLAIGRRIGETLYGPTGFRCPHCGHGEASMVALRPRMRRCLGCGRQSSVLRGTPMAHTKKPLYVWVLRGEYFEDGQVPTSTDFAEHAGCARSSAWEINQKFMANATHDGDLGEDSGTTTFPVVCRGPRGPDFGSGAPEYLRMLREQFKGVPRRETRVRLQTEGPVVSVQHSALPPDARRFDTVGLRRGYPHAGLERWMRAALEVRHGSVSLRWLARWLGHYCLLWSGQYVTFDAPPAWDVLVYGPHRPLRELRPYSAAAA